MNKKISAISSIFLLTLLVFTMLGQTVKGDDQTSLIYGKVGEIISDTDEHPFPPILGKDGLDIEIDYKEDVRVYVILSDENNILTSKCTFTDENGEYTISIPTGTYMLSTNKNGYENSVIDEVEVSADEPTELDIAIQDGTVDESKFFPLAIDESKEAIDTGIKDDNVGGEITVYHMEDESDYKKVFVIYTDLTITPINITEGNISLLVDGDENIGGRTIVINVEEEFFDLENDTIVEYDEKIISMADDLADILDPNDDGSNPEYLITVGANGIQILVSIPHFSEHMISIYSLPIEEITEEIVEEIKRYPEIAMMAAAAIIIVAAFFMIRRGKEVD